jgi:septal ring factor EnvC (AmiA/AmiB activator)
MKIKGFTDMKKQLICSSLTALMIYLLLCGPNYASEQKTTELNRKMAEISSLQQGLSKKIALVMQKQEQLRQKVDELEKEIKLEKAQLQTESYLKAIRNPRIEFNLKLIQLLFGYITGLSDKISHFQNGYETLDFFQQQAQDDLLMIKTLNDMEIDELIAQINSVLDEFIPELDKPVFDTNDIPSKDTEKIWNEIIQPQKAKG